VSVALACWLALVPHAEPEAAGAAGVELLDRWAQPHRRYHNREHLAELLRIVDEYADEAEDPDAVRLAAWYHDAVYHPARADNEERSAALAAAALPLLGVAPPRVAEVTRLVRLTAGHAPAAGDRNGALLCDADLAILAAPPARYAAYARAVREEYAHVPEDAFRAGRAAVLRGLLDLPVLYRIPRLRDAWELAARANVANELTGGVSGGAGPPPPAG
jgi:predicted metal-dependent HD superfamily phosphohydrolase